MQREMFAILANCFEYSNQGMYHIRPFIMFVTLCSTSTKHHPLILVLIHTLYYLTIRVCLQNATISVHNNHIFLHINFIPNV